MDVIGWLHIVLPQGTIIWHPFLGKLVMLHFLIAAVQEHITGRVERRKRVLHMAGFKPMTS